MLKVSQSQKIPIDQWGIEKDIFSHQGAGKGAAALVPASTLKQPERETL